MSEEQLSDIIGRIYDAALDPALWTEVIERASEFVGGRAVGIFAGDSMVRKIDAARDYGIDGPFRRGDVDELVKLDPPATGRFNFAVAGIVTTGDFLPWDEFLETGFHKQLARPQRWIDAVTSVLESERDELVDNETRRRMQLLVPHVRRAVSIGRTVKANGAAAAALADALDGVASAAFLVEANGRLLRTNESGQALLADRVVLRVHEGCLVAIDPGTSRLLQDTLAATGEGDESPGRPAISLPLPALDGRHCVAHILPLTAAARRRTTTGYAATAALFVHRVELGTPAAPELIARLYGLTPGELRVLLAVFDARGVADIARLLGISAGTAKTHLRRLFVKTGTKRQADLVKLVAAFAGRVR